MALTIIRRLVSQNSMSLHRFYSIKATSLIYNDFGDPVKVIGLVDQEIADPTGNEVLVKMLAAPVNPADINTIQGVYPEKPKFPAVPGNEGIGEVVSVGGNVEDLKPGDRVVPARNGLGTWRTAGIFSNNDLIKVPKDLGLAEAATLTVNPCTAYRMLKDFVQLQINDSVIQNGANSACGQNVIQICKAWGINTVNVVRNRSDIGDLKKYLTNLGATYVLTEEEIRSTDIFKSGKLKKPSLALNCVGGKSALEIMRQLNHSGVMVTYGGMSRDPVTVPTSAFIFKNIKACGYWMTQWNKDNATNPDRKIMFDELVQLMISKKLNAPICEFVKYNNYQNALMNTVSSQGYVGKKFLLDFAN